MVKKKYTKPFGNYKNFTANLERSRNDYVVDRKILCKIPY